MANSKLKGLVKRELVRAMYERIQGMDLENFGAPKAEDAIAYDNVQEILNIAYMNRNEVPLGMDIFKPIVPEGTELPVVVTIHGGGLTLGDRKISRPFGRILAHKGYLVFSIEYRLAPRVNVCMQLDDVCAGLDLVGQKLVDYDVDFNRIFIAAESAGAYLAAYVTAMKGSKKLQEAIGYEPSRVSFKAIGLMSGMLYTNKNKFLADQIYGDKRADEEFLQYMDPENPEILNNLPPAFLITSKADSLNSYSLQMNEALKRAGKPCHLVYYGDDDLMHAFTTLQSNHPKSIDSIDRMLAWFEEQAAAAANREKSKRSAATKQKKLLASMEDGSYNNRKIWQTVKAHAEADPERMYAPALIDCSRTYTYAQMFAKWEQYAKVFTALGITGKNKSRAAIVGSISAEPIFAYYGLNMVGTCVSMFSYPDLMPGGRWKTMVEKEHITDMIVSDIMVTPQMWEELRKAKLELGLRNIILLHTRMGGPCTGYGEMLYNEFNYTALRRLPDVRFIDDLIDKYADVTVKYAQKSGDQLAVITHTSGTTKGTRKPLPFTDSMINNIVSVAEEVKIINECSGGEVTGKRLVPPFDFSSSLNINGFVNYSLCSGQTIVLTFFGFMHPKFVHAFKYYGIDYSFASGFMIDGWMKMTDLPDDAFASLKTLGLGGSYVPPEKFKKYESFLRAHGFTGPLTQGYGMSELAGCSLIAPKDCSEDILGYPSNVEDFLVLDENDGKFYRTDEGERTGILYGRSSSMSLNTLDGEVLFELTEINGKNYLCTNDAVRVNKDGSLSYAGRSDKFFANSEGVKFLSGEVETLLDAQPAIGTCAAVPVLDKRIHDTVPVLYIIPADKGAGAKEAVRKAIETVFVTNDSLKESVLPSQFILVDNIPCNSNGKVDIYKITRSRLQGTAYNILPVKRGDQLVGIRCERAPQLNSFTGGTLPDGMGSDSAFGVFDIFSAKPKILKYKDLPKKYAEKVKTGKEKLVSALPEVKVSMPKMDMSTFSMSKLPKPVANAASLAMIFMQDQAITPDDYEE